MDPAGRDVAAHRGEVQSKDQTSKQDGAREAHCRRARVCQRNANVIQSSSDELCSSASSSPSDKRKSEREGRVLASKGADGGRSSVGKEEESGSDGWRVPSISSLAQEVAESIIALIAAAVAASGSLAASLSAPDEKAAAEAASVMEVCRAQGSRSGGGAARRMAIL